MATGKAIDLRVRPVLSVDLCYPVDGVIGRQSATLIGQPVQGLDVGQSLYPFLGQTDPQDSGRLMFHSNALYGRVAGSVLSSLRNEPQAVDVDTAVTMRWNTYLSTYSPDAIAKARETFWDDPNDASSPQWALLSELEEQSRHLNALLAQAYKDAGLENQVVKLQKSTNDNKATQYAGAQHVQFEGISDQTMDLIDFRIPSIENTVRYLRARLGLRMESLNAWRQAEKYRTDRSLYNELDVIDQQIRKLQVRYLDTFLISPFDGVVTGVFRGVGDYVRAGQPVIRVENDERIYLVGTIKYRGPLRVGDTITVTTTLFDAPGTQPTVTQGNLAAVRGHDAVDEQWDVMIECANRTAGGEPVLPVNYNFDFKSTTLEV
ncbi:hypothetical protein K6V92_16185 [Cupriavidus respiraculi]|uniref:HlyD family efflux transporter periplasmic adaptor subunit n=1 Tax=Cupriavidus respiraculi TaxID=195930 RepID=UPI001C95D780|nr:HlyD family efflux transporter periplasmic adaptor subunit [Cupriavidus respiraculi]MBY4948156.1 hypothetical protein [Cupriavidus respiraculi]